MNIYWEGMMITEKQYREAQKRAVEYFEKAGIVITEKEKGNIEHELRIIFRCQKCNPFNYKEL